jgi:mRNA interferase MazF
MISVKRGEIWLADLNPIRGSEQAGVRPVLIFQNELLNKVTSTVIAIPLTTNLKRASLPSCVFISKGEGGLENDSVILCHQLRVLDKSRLLHKLGKINAQSIAQVETKTLFTMGII